MTPEELIELARKAKEFSYSPYSNFKVGAALITTCGKVYTGTNVENVGHTSAICAERLAIAKAVSEGFLEIKEIAVISDKSDVISPCGVCRQTTREFGRKCVFYLARKDGSYETWTMEQLLPISFGPDSLKL